MENQYFEIPITVFKSSGEPEEFETYYFQGSEDEARHKVAKALGERYADRDYDYDVVAISEDEFKSVKNPNVLSAIEEGSPRSIEDEMEDLSDKYYTLQDRLNSNPVEAGLSIERVNEANNYLAVAREAFDQFDFFRCQDALRKAEEVISSLDSKVAHESIGKAVLEAIEGDTLTGSAETDITMKYSMLSEAIKAEDETVILYRQYRETCPEWADILDDIIREEEKHVGQLRALMNSLSSEIAENIEKGEEEGEQQEAEQDGEQYMNIEEAEVDIDED